MKEIRVHKESGTSPDHRFEYTVCLWASECRTAGLSELLVNHTSYWPPIIWIIWCCPTRHKCSQKTGSAIWFNGTKYKMLSSYLKQALIVSSFLRLALKRQRGIQSIFTSMLSDCILLLQLSTYADLSIYRLHAELKTVYCNDYDKIWYQSVCILVFHRHIHLKKKWKKPISSFLLFFLFYFIF